MEWEWVQVSWGGVRGRASRDHQERHDPHPGVVLPAAPGALSVDRIPEPNPSGAPALDAFGMDVRVGDRVEALDTDGTDIQGESRRPSGHEKRRAPLGRVFRLALAPVFVLRVHGEEYPSPP